MQVPEAYVERIDLVPDVDKGQLSVLVHGSAAARGLKVLVSIVLAHVMSVVGKAGTS